MSAALWLGSVGGTLLVGPTADDVNQLDAAIRNLDTDIANSPILVQRPALDPTAMAFRKFKGDWVSFRIKWEAWKNDHVDVVSRSTEESATSFGNTTNEYNEYRRRFVTEFGGQTDAPVAEGETKPPGTGLPWGTILVVGGLAVGAAVLLPQIGMLASLRRAKE